MKKTNILIIMLMLCFTISVFSQTTEYSDTPENAELDVQDLTLYEGYKAYSGRNMNLPRYIPQYLGQELYLANYSKYSQKVIGRYVPRFWDGEKYNNFRTDGYDPKNLNSEEISLLDQITLNMYSKKDTQNKCNFVIDFRTTKDFNPSNSKELKNLINISYYYDLGYWYVPEIKETFYNDCPYLFADMLVAGKYRYISDYGITTDPIVTSWCGREDSPYEHLTISTVNTEILKLHYEASSYLELATKMYNDPTTTKNVADGTCTYNTTFTHDCISEEQLLKILKTKDNWMLEVFSGNYIPLDIEYLGNSGYDEVFDYLYARDSVFRNCQDNYLSTNFVVSSLKYVFDSSYKQNYDYCEQYMENTIRSKLDVTGDWTREGVQSVIWNHYADTFKIQEGTNLYPYNIKFSGIRCRENDSYYSTGAITPLNPIGETPYVTCNYTSSDPENVKVGFYFDVRINPVFSLVAGSDSIDASYNTEYFRHVFRNYDINLSDIKLKNFTGGFTIVSWVDLNRSKEDGCTFVYISNESITNVVKAVDVGNQELQKESERVPQEVIRQLDVQVRLLRAEVEKTQMFFYVDLIAKLVFRMFVLMYYCLSVVFILYIVKLVLSLPQKMLDIIRTLGTSKKQRKMKSILNED